MDKVSSLAEDLKKLAATIKIPVSDALIWRAITGIPGALVGGVTGAAIGGTSDKDPVQNMIRGGLYGAAAGGLGGALLSKPMADAAYKSLPKKVIQKAKRQGPRFFPTTEQGLVHKARLGGGLMGSAAGGLAGGAGAGIGIRLKSNRSKD